MGEGVYHQLDPQEVEGTQVNMSVKEVYKALWERSRRTAKIVLDSIRCT